MKHKSTLFKSLALLFLMTNFVFAQQPIRNKIIGEKGTTKHLTKLPANEQIFFAPANAKQVVGLDQNADLNLKESMSDPGGNLHYRYTQSYKGIPVENAMYIMHAKGGKLTGMSGVVVLEFQQMANLKSTADVSQAAAIQSALNYVQASTYAWQLPSRENEIKQMTGNPSATYYPSPSLVWYSPNAEIDAANMHLAYKIDVYAVNPLSRANYFVDASNGSILGVQPILKHADAVGTANTAFSGSRSIHSDDNSGTFTLRDLSRGNGVVTYRPNGSDYTNSSANWNLSGLDQYALDAHWGVEQTYDYFQTVHSRNSINGAGIQLVNYVVDTTIHNNAYWDGTAMHYGVRWTDAGQIYGAGITAIDVTGHELTHGLTDYTSNLVYTKESGAINESMSDIFGKSVQFFAKPDDIDWRLSNDINWIIRTMSNPNANGQPDTYKGTNWVNTIGCVPTGGPSGNDYCGVHTNSGVGNFMFYLLAMGGTGTNDNGTDYCVSGIGLEKAQKIMYNTEVAHLTSTSSYPDWRDYSLEAAVFLYGSGSNEEMQVANAWSAVGLSGINTGALANHTICAPSSFSVPYTLDATITFNAGNTFTVQLSDASGSFASPVNIGSVASTTAGSINATIPAGTPYGTGYRIRVVSSDPATIGSSNCTDISVNYAAVVTTNPASASVQWGDNASFTAAASGSPAPSIQWQISTDEGNNYTNIATQTESTLSFTCVTLDMNGNRYRAAFTNVCGTVYSDAAVLTVTEKTITAGIVVSPNPRQYSDTVNIRVSIPGGYTCSTAAADSAQVFIGTQYVGTVFFSIDGSDLAGQLNTVYLLEPTPFGTAPTGQMAPGARAVTAVLYGVNSNYQITNNGTILNITQEDARVYYTGAVFSGTSTATSSNAVVTLSATIRDITAEMSDAAYDQWPGDIRNARVTFINRDNNSVIASNVPVGLVNANDTKTGTATYNWSTSITGTSQSFTIGIIVTNYYTRNNSADNTLITVSQPNQSNFVTGGGYIILSNSSGIKAGDAGSKNNFGFNAKYNRSGSQIQGNLNTIVRRTETDGLHTYQIKSNRLTSISVTPSSVGGIATINGRASIQDITNPLAPVSVDGNATMQLEMTDNGEPGNTDSVSITIWNKNGGMWFASKWNGVRTVKKVLDAGNVQSSRNNAVVVRMQAISEDEEATSLACKVYPNPNNGQFNLEFSALENTVYTIRVTDMMGKICRTEIIQAEEGQNVKSFYLNELADGFYLMSVESGNDYQLIKVIVSH